MDEKEKKKDGYKEKEQPISDKKQFSSQKPWWVVAILMLLLAAFGVYVWWSNSPLSTSYPSVWAYLVSPRQTGNVTDTTISQIPDASLENGMIPTDQQTSDSLDNSWESVDTETQPATSGADSSPAPAEASSVDDTSPQPTYYIKAGEFKTRAAALARIKELRQGNYAAQIADPQTAEGTYVVTVGEFKNLKTASSKSREINFILEIKTTVEKKQ